LKVKVVTVPDLPTNTFEVFSREKAGNENHLTRALLVLLHLSPLAHEVWLRRLGLGAEGITSMGEPGYSFQTAVPTAPDLGDDGGEMRGISVFISREPAYNGGPIVQSDRRQIPDALITYPGPEPPILVVVESKVREMADALQARDINLGTLKPKWSPTEPVEVLWSDLIDDLWALIDLRVASGSEERVLLDFFDFIDHYYREVGPFSSIRRCGGVKERIRRRCRRLLQEATALEAKEPSHAHGPFVEMEGVPSLPRRVAFDVDQGHASLRLSFWPADTPSQARAFYSDGPLVDRVLELCALAGWGGEPNMHFGHFQRGYAWLPVPDQTYLAAYAVFWRKNEDLISTVYRPETADEHQRSWDELLDRLLEARIITDREGFDRDFVETNRNKADVRPGLEIYREWPIDLAAELDETGVLALDLREAFEITLAAFQPTSGPTLGGA
jgi:hypothetical protein